MESEHTGERKTVNYGEDTTQSWNAGGKDPNEQRPKRRKISTACEPCRARKTRCDGNRPICRPCLERPHDSRLCEYAPTKTDTSSGGTSALVQRIRDLERQLEGSAYRQSGESTSATLLTAHEKQIQRQDVLHGSYQVSASHSIAKVDPTRQITQTGNIHFSGKPHIPYSVTDNAHLAQSSLPSPSLPSPSTGTARNFSIESLLDREEGEVSAMGATAFSNNRGSVATNEFYGSSSAAYFMNQVKEGIQARESYLNASRQAQANHGLNKAETPSSSADLLQQSAEDIVLPSREFADQLLDVYWSISHTLYPFLDRPSMERSYSNLWESKTARREHGSLDLGLGSTRSCNETTRVFQCAINAIFALSCQLAPLSVHLHDRQTLSDRFFRRCREYLHIDVLDHGSLAFVQTLLIITQYLQSTQSPSRCWNSLGLACRIGQGLGLHVEDASTDHDPRQVEIRRRIWHGCNIMDSVASMTLGRPMMTHQHNLPLPASMSNESFMDNGDHLGQEKQSILSFYVETIKLYQLLGKVVTDIYKPWTTYSTEDPPRRRIPGLKNEMQTILMIADELRLLEEEIIPILHWERGKDARAKLSEPSVGLIQRQSNILHARYLHTELLLHRPCFLQVCRDLASTWQSGSATTPAARSKRRQSLRANLEFNSAVQCVTAAVNLITTLHASTTDETGGAWWYTMFYLYSAGMVVVLLKSCLPMRDHFETEVISHAWMDCCVTMELLRPYGVAAELGLKSLLAMSDRLVTSTPAEVPSSASSDQRMRSSFPSRAYPPQPLSNGISQTDPDDAQDLAQSMEPIDQDIWASRQPLMDFMDNDLDTTLPGMLEDNWWGFSVM